MNHLEHYWQYEIRYDGIWYRVYRNEKGGPGYNRECVKLSRWLWPCRFYRWRKRRAQERELVRCRWIQARVKREEIIE